MIVDLIDSKLTTGNLQSHDVLFFQGLYQPGSLLELSQEKLYSHDLYV